MITIENADKALKDYYLQAVSAQLNNGISPFFTGIEKSAQNVYGKDVKMSVVRGLTGCVAAGDEDGDLPDPYKNRYIEICVPLKNIYGTIEISDKALRASRDSSGAFVSLLNAEMEGLIASAKHNFQRMLFGDGSGKICDVVDGTDGYSFKVTPAKAYFDGMCIDAYRAGQTKSGDDGVGLHVVAVDPQAGTLKVKEYVADSYKGGTFGLHGAKGKELTGLAAIFEGDSLYGYNRDDEPYFKPLKKDLNGSLTEDDLCDVLDELEEQFNSKINMIICSFKTRKKIAALISQNRRVVNTIDAASGVGNVTVNGVTVYADAFCPEDVIYFLNTEDFSLNQLCDWEWLEDEDGKILKQIPGKAAYSATLVKYAELICKKPCGQAKLYNFTNAENAA